MAENKKSFTAYCDWNTTFNSLPDDKAGQLIKHLFAYVNDENPVTDDLLINAVFANIKATLKRDLIKWKEKSEKNKQIAIDRWNKNANKGIEINTNACERIKNDANYTDNVSVSVNDNVKDKINNIDERKLKFASTLKPFVDLYGKELIREFYNYWTEPNKSNTKFRQETEKTWSLERRLETWAKNDINFNKNKNGTTSITESEQFKNLTKAIRSTGDRI